MTLQLRLHPLRRSAPTGHGRQTLRHPVPCRECRTAETSQAVFSISPASPPSVGRSPVSGIRPPAPVRPIESASSRRRLWPKLPRPPRRSAIVTEPASGGRSGLRSNSCSPRLSRTAHSTRCRLGSSFAFACSGPGISATSSWPLLDPCRGHRRCSLHGQFPGSRPLPCHRHGTRLGGQIDSRSATLARTQTRSRRASGVGQCLSFTHRASNMQLLRLHQAVPAFTDPGWSGWTKGVPAFELAPRSIFGLPQFSGEVGPRRVRFVACSTFTRVPARMFGEPPLRPFDTRVLQTISLPP